MNRKKEEKTKSICWVYESLRSSLCYESQNGSFAEPKLANRRSKSLSSRVDQDFFLTELNVASTNQTSLEISLDETAATQNQGSFKTRQQTSESVPKKPVSRKSSAKNLRSKIFPIFNARKKKTDQNEFKISEAFTKPKLKGKRKAANQKKNRENVVTSSNGTSSSRKGSEKNSEHGKGKFKVYVPVLSSKNLKNAPEKAKTSEKASHEHANDKKIMDPNIIFEKVDHQPEGLLDQPNDFHVNNLISDEKLESSSEDSYENIYELEKDIESVKENEEISFDFVDEFESSLMSQDSDSKNIPEPPDLIFPKSFGIKIDTQPKFSFLDSKKKSFPNFFNNSPSAPSQVFISPLKSVKKFQNPNKLPENPYDSYQISSEFHKNLEELQKKLLFTDSSSENSIRSLESLESNLLEKFQVIERKSTQSREPSFGFGGCEFEYKETPSTEELIFYQPDERASKTFTDEKNDKIGQNTENIEEMLYKFSNSFDKLTNTEKTSENTSEKLENLAEIIKLINDESFVNSLKVIGKFAKFLKINCKN